MPRRIPKRSTILTDAEVRAVTRGVPAVFGEALGTALELYGLNLEGIVRFQAVAHRCIEARQAKGWTVKEVAAALRVPQYRIKDLEMGHIGTLEPEVLAAYLKHLSLEAWYRRWKRSNPKLAASLAPAKRKAR